MLSAHSFQPVPLCLGGLCLEVGSREQEKVTKNYEVWNMEEREGLWVG